MPTKEIEAITVNFVYNDKIYHLRTTEIYDNNNNYMCKCDLTGTVFYGNYEQMRFIATQCLASYLYGFQYGKDVGIMETQNKLKSILGI